MEFDDLFDEVLSFMVGKYMANKTRDFQIDTIYQQYSNEDKSTIIDVLLELSKMKLLS